MTRPTGEAADSPRVRDLTALVAAMITSERAGPLLVAAAGELVTEYARFNLWVLDRKPRSTARDLWNLALIADQCLADCSAAWDSYLGVGSGGHDQPDPGELIRRLITVTERLRTLRTTDRIDYDDPEAPDELGAW